MTGDMQFTFSFSGNNSDAHMIDLYDAAQALIGFQRSLALTTHLALNDSIITQSPSLKGARIYALPSEEGSWRINAVIALTALYNLGATPNNTPLGHIVYSLYDYVISESLGVHVDYNRSLGQLYEQAEAMRLNLPIIKQSQADSLIEKCSVAIKDMHRPIYKSGSATIATISSNIKGQNFPLNTPLTNETYEYIHESNVSERPEQIVGKVSSYNSNTYKGRIFTVEVGRPTSFELADKARTEFAIKQITASLSANALRHYNESDSHIVCMAHRITSRSGQLKGFIVTEVTAGPSRQ